MLEHDTGFAFINPLINFAPWSFWRRVRFAWWALRGQVVGFGPMVVPVHADAPATGEGVARA